MTRLLPWLAVFGCGTPAVDDSGPGDSGDAPCERLTWHADRDGDGFGAPADTRSACVAPEGFVDDDADCDDRDPAVHPGADEHCDLDDEDCDGAVDEDAIDAIDWFADADADGWGGALAASACQQPSGTVPTGGDCDDADPAVSPGAVELWTDWIDTDCDGVWERPHPVETLFGVEAPTSSWQQEAGRETVLHIVAVYGTPIMRVHVDVLHPTVLVLSSYDDVAWRVTEARPGIVQGVRLYGARGESVVLADAPVEVGSARLRFSDDFDARATQEAVADAEAATGLRVQSFSGAYDTTGTIVLREAPDYPADGAYPDCDGYTGPSVFPAVEPDPAAVEAACPVVTRESTWCLTDDGTDLLAIGAITGATCRLGPLALRGAVPADGASFAWIGDDLYTCGGADGMLLRYSLSTGTVEKTWFYCDGVVRDGDVLRTLHRGSLADTATFPSWEDARCGSPTWGDIGWPSSASRFTAEDGVLWSASHSPDSVQRTEIATGAGLDPLSLGFDGWTFGLDVVDDKLAVLGAPTGYALRLHDATTGEELGAIPLATRHRGLACMSGP